MPRDGAGVLADDIKVDVLAFLLEANLFPAAKQGQEMDARGLLYRDGGETLLNLTSLRAVNPTCAN